MVYEIYEVYDDESFQKVDEFETREAAEKGLAWLRGQSRKAYEMGLVAA
jgi:hypothetical protein